MIVEGVISVWSSVPPPPIITSAPPPAPPPLPQLHPHPPPHYNWALIQSRVIKNFHTGSADGHSTEFPSYMLNHCTVLAQHQSICTDIIKAQKTFGDKSFITPSTSCPHSVLSQYYKRFSVITMPMMTKMDQGCYLVSLTLSPWWWGEEGRW